MKSQLSRYDSLDSASSPTFLRPDTQVGWAEDCFHLSVTSAGIRHPLTPAGALALLLLGRTGSTQEAWSYLDRLGPGFTNALDYVKQRFPTYLGSGEQRPFEVAWWGEKLRMANPREGRREAAPASITWLVTLECNRRCPYCFYKIIPVSDENRHRPRDASLSTEKALRAIAEMGRIGTADLYLTGGEPLPVAICPT